MKFITREYKIKLTQDELNNLLQLITCAKQALEKESKNTETALYFIDEIGKMI